MREEIEENGFGLDEASHQAGGEFSRRSSLIILAYVSKEMPKVG
jgi:hypothetical protein